MLQRFLFSFLFVLFLWGSPFQPAYGQHKRQTTEEYIKKYKDVAVKKMREYKIPASITLAQAILESGSGNSKLARKANNHFGIKCHKDWKGKRYYMDDDVKHECFRKYKKPSESFNDHSLFLTTRGRYSFLFQYDITDYKKWAYGLKKAGYATNPKYPRLLISIIERYHLDRYDQEALSGKKRKQKRDNTTAVAPPSVSDLQTAGESPSGRYRVYLNNGRKLIIAKQGDSYQSIAREFEMYLWQLYKYNDKPKNEGLNEGEWVYLQKKRRKAERKYRYHIVRQGETLRHISQLYGIKLSRLYKMNNLPVGIQCPVGTRLKVR